MKLHDFALHIYTLYLEDGIGSHVHLIGHSATTRRAGENLGNPKFPSRSRVVRPVVKRVSPINVVTDSELACPPRTPLR